MAGVVRCVPPCMEVHSWCGAICHSLHGDTGQVWCKVSLLAWRYRAGVVESVPPCMAVQGRCSTVCTFLHGGTGQVWCSESIPACKQ